MKDVFHYRNPVIFDLETDGSNEKQVIQIGAIAPATGKKFEVKVRFRENWANHKVLDLCHYDPAVWKAEAVSRGTARRLFNEFLEAHASMTRISREKRTRFRVAAGMGWNAHAFDRPVLSQFYRNHFLPMDGRIFDVMQLCFWLFPELPSYKLSDVARAMNVLHEPAHEAIADCEMTADIVAVLLQEEWAGLGHKLPDWIGNRMKEIMERE